MRALIECLVVFAVFAAVMVLLLRWLAAMVVFIGYGPRV